METLNHLSGIAVTILFWAQAVVVTFSSVAIVAAYLKKGDDRLLHIASIGTAHCIFSIMAVTALNFGLYPLFSIRGAAAFTAFVLTDYGLAKIGWKAAAILFPNKFEAVK